MSLAFCEQIFCCWKRDSYRIGLSKGVLVKKRYFNAIDRLA